MRKGLEWYHRKPATAVGGMVGLTARQQCVYNLIIDLTCMHGGDLPNDPKWISGYIRDMSPTQVKNTLLELVDADKIEIKTDRIREENALKTVQKFLKTSQVNAQNGSKGGQKSSQNATKLNPKSNKNKAPLQAVASNPAQAAKQAEKKEERERLPYSQSLSLSEATGSPATPSQCDAGEPPPCDESTLEFMAKRVRNGERPQTRSWGQPAARAMVDLGMVTTDQVHKIDRTIEFETVNDPPLLELGGLR